MTFPHKTLAESQYGLLKLLKKGPLFKRGVNSAGANLGSEQKVSLPVTKVKCFVFNTKLDQRQTDLIKTGDTKSC